MVLDLLHDGLTRLDADGVPQPALAAELGRPTTSSTAFRFHARPRRHLRQRPGRHRRGRDRLARAGDGGGRHLARRAVARGRQGLPRRSPTATPSTSAASPPPTPAPSASSSTTPLSVLPERPVEPGALGRRPGHRRRATSPTSTSAARGRWRPRTTATSCSTADPRTGAVDDDRAAAPTTTRTPPTTAFEDGDVDWAQVPADRATSEAVEEYGDDAFAPFQAELFFGMNVDTPALAAPRRSARRSCWPSTATRSCEAVYADLADPLATVVPAGVPGHDPDRCPACAPDPDAGRRASSPSAFPDGDVPDGAHRLRRVTGPGGDGRARGRQTSRPSASPPSCGPCRSRSTRRSSCRATRSSSASGGSAPTRRPTPTWRRCSGRRPTTTSPATGRPRWTLCSSDARASPDAAKNAERWARAEEAGARGRGRRAHRPVPHPGGRRRPCARASSTPSTAPSTGPR